MAWLTPRTGRLVAVVAPAQSNGSGVDSQQSGAPADNARNIARFFKRDIRKRIVPAVESLHANVDPNLTGGDGFSWVSVAINDWLDYAPTKTALVIPRAVGSTLMATHWAHSPEGVMTKRAIDDTLLGGLSADDRVVFLVLKGEGEASNDDAAAAALGPAIHAWLARARTRLARPEAPALICQLPEPGVAGRVGWNTVQAGIAALAQVGPPAQTVVTNPSSISDIHYTAAQHTALGHAAGTALISLVPDW